MEKCIGCHWCANKDNKFKCHFNPPMVVGGSGTGWSDTIWPMVYPDDYCSEWYDKVEGGD